MAAKGRPASKPAMVHIRLDSELHNNLRKAADESGATLQAEIIKRLGWTFGGEDHTQRDIRELRARIERLEQMELFLRIPKR